MTCFDRHPIGLNPTPRWIRYCAWWGCGCHGWIVRASTRLNPYGWEEEDLEFVKNLHAGATSNGGRFTLAILIAMSQIEPSYYAYDNVGINSVSGLVSNRCFEWCKMPRMEAWRGTAYLSLGLHAVVSEVSASNLVSSISSLFLCVLVWAVYFRPRLWEEWLVFHKGTVRCLIQRRCIGSKPKNWTSDSLHSFFVCTRRFLVVFCIQMSPIYSPFQTLLL